MSGITNRYLAYEAEGLKQRSESLARKTAGQESESMTELQFATVRLTTGPRIHYAEHGDGDGEPVIFLHGWPDSWFSFSRVIPFLSRRLHAFVLDQRGFGDSERPRGGYGINEFAADVVAFLDAVSVERTTIVGHSFGSFVTRRVAVTHPERVGRMVLIGTGASAANPVTREVQAAMADLQDPVPMEFARNFQASTAYAGPYHGCDPRCQAHDLSRDWTLPELGTPGAGRR